MGTRQCGCSNRRQLRGHAAFSSRAGSARQRRRAPADVRRRLGMDAQLLLALSRLSRRAGRARRVQRQVHVQPVRAARRLVRDFAGSHSRELSQFFPAGKTLAVYRHPARARSGMSRAAGAIAVLDLEPAASDFLAEAIAGLSKSPRTLPSKFFYDERGSDLFQAICELPEYYVTRTER